MNLKESLLKHCKMFVNKRLQTVEEILHSHQKSLQSETKSSAGDKHETGRAMIQLEMEKASQQLTGISEMNEILSKIETMHKNKQKINTMIIFEIVRNNYQTCNNLKDYHIKSWIYRFIKKYQLKSRYFEKKKKINLQMEEQSYFEEIETIEYNRLNNKPFYIEKVIIVGNKVGING